MELYLCEFDPQFTQKQISGNTYALLRRIFSERFSLPAPEILRTENGKPYFEGLPCHFSISHSGNMALIAISDSEIGVDIQLHSGSKQNPRLFSEQMLAEFGYYDGWVLRESVFKLCGNGSLRNMEFSRANGHIISPFDNVACRLYHIRDGVSIAVASYSDNFPDKIINIREIANCS